MWTQDIVFKRQNLRHYVPPPIMKIELVVQHVKLLGVLLVSTLSACTHIDSIITTMNQRLSLLDQLRRQGLSITRLITASLTLAVARLQYALPAIGGFLTADDISRINTVFVDARKWRLPTTVPTATDLIERVDEKLCKAALDVKHCLHSLLPPVRDSLQQKPYEERHFAALRSN